jgi:hypothetical protein
VPDLKVSFSLYLPFKGKIIEILRAGTPGSLEFFHRMETNGIYFAYLNKKDLPTWENWIKVRHPDEGFFKHFSEGLENQIKINLALYKSSAYEKTKIVPAFYPSQVNYDEKLKKRFHEILNDPRIIWFFNEIWVEKYYVFSSKLSLFIQIFLDHLSDHLKIYDEMNVLTFSVIHNLVSIGMEDDFKGPPEESTNFYLTKKDMVLNPELLVFFNLNKEICQMKKKGVFKFDPSMPKGFQVFCLCRDFLDNFNRAKVTGDKKMQASFNAIKVQRTYEESMIGHLETFLVKVKLNL